MQGKGSTCAFLESILRRRGLRTGFFSSPHLVNATERIRLDGQPVSQVSIILCSFEFVKFAFDH